MREVIINYEMKNERPPVIPRRGMKGKVKNEK
jgi:hypothetical protein